MFGVHGALVAIATFVERSSSSAALVSDRAETKPLAAIPALVGMFPKQRPTAPARIVL